MVPVLALGFDDLQELDGLCSGKEGERLLAKALGGGVVACVPVLLRDGEALEGLVFVALHAGRRLGLRSEERGRQAEGEVREMGASVVGEDKRQ